jgi:hypothetical protein
MLSHPPLEIWKHIYIAKLMIRPQHPAEEGEWEKKRNTEK